MDNGEIMTATLERLTKEIQTLPADELDEFLSWLAKFEAEQMDAWDKEIEQDSMPEGRLKSVINRVHRDIAAGRTKPLDEILDNS